jgi:uncharacterized protein (DUF2147 family)
MACRISMAAVWMAVAALGCATLTDAQAGDPTGVWLTQQGDARVRVSRCGGGMCGAIIGLRDPIDEETGRPATDKKNPDPSRRNRPLIGTQLILGMQPAGGDKWSGRIYNADDGKVYAGSIQLTGPSSLKIEGCVAMFCGSETWTRVR